jgi:hypothetical protein
LPPLAVAADGRALSTVDELSERDFLLTVLEHMEGLEVVGGSVLEAEAQEVTEIGWLATPELDDEGAGKVG